MRYPISTLTGAAAAVMLVASSCWAPEQLEDPLPVSWPAEPSMPAMEPAPAPAPVVQPPPAPPAGHWIEVVATAYSPHDSIDDDYRATKGRWLYKTADGRTDVRSTPYGVAVPLLARSRKPAIPFGTKLVIPAGLGYLDRSRQDRVFVVDDVGNGKEYYPERGGRLHVDLRFRDHASAVRWAGPRGYRFISVFVLDE